MADIAQPAVQHRASAKDAAARRAHAADTDGLTRLTAIGTNLWRGLSERAIAIRLRVPLGSVKSWKRRGLNRLATLLGEESS